MDLPKKNSCQFVGTFADQVLLKRCSEEGATVCPHKENDHLQLAEAAAKLLPQWEAK